jgi:hypothetical protein
MFINQNRFKFGKQEDGTEVGDVEMPPWAKNPDDFVRINRMASLYFCILESMQLGTNYLLVCDLRLLMLIQRL